MLRLKELQKVVELKSALGIPLNEGSCFGVQNPRELRPSYRPKKTDTDETKPTNSEKN